MGDSSSSSLEQSQEAIRTTHQLPATTSKYDEIGFQSMRHRRLLSDDGGIDKTSTRRAPVSSTTRSSKSRSTSTRFAGKHIFKNRTAFRVLLFLSILFVTLSFALYAITNNEQQQKSPERMQMNAMYTKATKESSHTILYQTEKDRFAPRLVYLEEIHGFTTSSGATSFHTRLLEDDVTLHAPPGEEVMPQDDYYSSVQHHHDEDCVYASPWQTSSFPNCNTIHELELQAAGRTAEQNIHDEHAILSHMGNGWFRDAWQVEMGAKNETVVLKTLR